MPISNRNTKYVQNKIGKFTGAEQARVNNTLDVLEHDPLATGHKCTRAVMSYGDTIRVVQVVNGIVVEYKFDIAGLVTIIDIYRSPWHTIKILIGDFSPAEERI